MLTTFLLWVFGVALVVFLAHWTHQRQEYKKLIDKIPGPPVTPIVGNLNEIFVHPVQLWRNLRRLAAEHYPIYRLWAGHVATVILLSPDDIETLIASSKNIGKSRIYDLLHGWLGTGLLTSTGDKWQLRRKLLTPAFHFNILKEFIKVFEEQSDVLIKQLKEECNKPYIDIVPFVTKFTLHSICETAMGTQVNSSQETQDSYRKAIYKMGDLVVYRVGRPWLYSDLPYYLTKAFREQKRLAKILHSFSTNVIRNRIRSIGNKKMVDINKLDEHTSSKKRLAMLDLLISAKNSGAPIDEDGIREEVDTFMFEGHDTTTMAICFTLMLLGCHPDIQEKVVMELKEVVGDTKENPSYQTLQELKYLDRVLKESLRVFPSVPFISRITSEDVHTPSGYTIPEGTYVNVPIYDLHHNPEYFPKPWKFDPDRFLPENTQNRHPFCYIPFSAGPRNCIGQKFAFLELKTVIAKILMNFSLHAVDTPKDITFMVDLVLRTTDGIKIKIQPRNL